MNSEEQDQEITLPIEIIEYLTCGLCKGILRNPYTINECVHTFCKKCIFTYFNEKSGRDCCPLCKTNLGGRPFNYLIFDSTLSEFVDQLFPEFREMDDQISKKMYSAFRKNNEALNDDLLRDKCTIVLQPFNMHDPKRLPNLDFPEVVVQTEMDIRTLKKYLSNKFENIQPEEIQILCKNQPQPDEYKLKNIFSLSLEVNRNEKLVLSYQRKN